MSQTQEKKKSYTVLTAIAVIGFITFIGALGFEVWKPIIFNQYKFLNLLLKVGVAVTLISLIIELILAIFDGAHSIKEKRNNRKNVSQPQENNYQSQQPVNNYQPQSQANNYNPNPAQNSTPLNNGGFQELNSPIHPNVVLQTKYEGKTFVVRIKQKMRLINNQQ